MSKLFIKLECFAVMDVLGNEPLVRKNELIAELKESLETFMVLRLGRDIIIEPIKRDKESIPLGDSKFTMRGSVVIDEQGFRESFVHHLNLDPDVSRLSTIKIVDSKEAISSMNILR